jgi:hypothetical protein
MNEAIEELKENEFKDLYPEENNIEKGIRKRLANRH